MKEHLGMNPWLSMWTRPKQTIRAIVSYKPSHRFVVLSFIYGLNYIFGYMMILSLGNHYPLWMLVTIALIFAVPVGALVLTIFSVLVLWLGKLVGGKASFKEVRAAVAWASVGYLPVLFTWVGSMILFGNNAFIDGVVSKVATNGASMLITNIFFFIDVVAFVWLVVMFVKALGEVQRFSAWMALLNVVLVLVIVGALKWAVMLIGN